jgi:pimeloyl-ACP methyl ester carboxylesterase
MPIMSRRSVIAGGAAIAAEIGFGSASASAMAGPPESVVVQVEGVPVHLLRAGRGQPVCLIHGASGNLNDMTFRLAPLLAGRYDVIAVDRPGFGRSGMPRGGNVSINAQAALMRDAISAIGVREPILVGHSYGGSVALAWATDAPDSISGLVLLATPSQVWAGGLGFTNDVLANPLTGPVLARAIPYVVTRGFAETAVASIFSPQSTPDGYLDHLDLDLVLQPTSLRENALQLASLREQVREMVPLYRRLDLPVELVHGDADVTVGFDLHSVPLARQLPHANLTRLPGIGHMVHQVATMRVIEAIDTAAR